MKVFGLTGGIACGKTSVALMLAERGVHIIDADQLARTVVEPGTETLRAIAKRFGEDVIAPDGGLDRARLAAHVFADPSAREALNQIVHPAIAARAASLVETARRGGEPFVVYDAALIVENEIHKGLDGLIVVAVPEETQRERLRARDGLSDEDVDRRLASQLPTSRKLAVADWVIDNSGTRLETARQVDALVDALRRASRNDSLT